MSVISYFKSKRGWIWIVCSILISEILLPSCRKDESQIRTENLLENISGLDLLWDTGCVDLGTKSSRSHLLGSWSPNKTARNGTTFAASYEPSAVEFKALNIKDRSIKVHCRTQSPAAVEIKPVLNGVELAANGIGGRWQDWEIDVPGNSLHLGNNLLSFKRPDKNVAMDVDSICFESSPGSRDSLDTLRAASEAPAKQEPLIMPPDSMLNLYFKTPHKGRLRLQYGLQKESSEHGSAVRFDIFLEDQNGTKATLISEPVQYGYFFSPSRSHEINLDRYENKAVRISMRISSMAGKPVPSAVLVERALLSYPKVAAHKIPTQTSIDPTNVFIYLVDTLRADHLEPYGYRKPVSPRLEEFAHDAVIFDRAYAQTTWTRSSIACIQAGVFQSSHMIEDRADVLPDFLPTIQSTLKSHGYFNYGFVTNSNVSPVFNFGKHFDKYFRLGESKVKRGLSTNSAELFQIVEQAVKNTTNRDLLYMYIHAMDPHQPYTPDVAYPGKLLVPECEGIKGKNEQSRDCIIALYDGEIYNSDFYFGKFIDLLRELNLYQDALIIFTADHGESLGDHGAAHHGKTLYEAEIRVPLLIKFPGNRFAGKRVPQTVRHIDIFPTMLDLFSFTVPKCVQGKTLLPMITGNRQEDHPVFSELLLDDANKKSIVYGNHKVIASYGMNKNSGEDFVLYEMYDVVTDGGELRDVSNQNQILFGYLRMELDKWSKQQMKRRSALKKPKEAVLDDETKDILRALGYLQ